MSAFSCTDCIHYYDFGKPVCIECSALPNGVNFEGLPDVTWEQQEQNIKTLMLLGFKHEDTGILS